MEKNTLIEFSNLARVMADYAADLSAVYQEKLLGHDRRASGELISSVTTRVSVNDRTYRVELDLAAYWKYVEWDTKPHWPPVSKILEWIKIKPVIPRPMENGKLPTDEQLAFLIGRKISRVGTTGSHDLRDSLAEVNGKYYEQLQKAIAADIGDAFQQYLLMLTLD